MLVVIGLLFIPYDPEPLTLDDLAHIQLGRSFEEISREIGGGDWVSDADLFTVAYEIEGEMRLVLVFEDGIHLSMATLHRTDGSNATMGTISATEYSSP